MSQQHILVSRLGAAPFGAFHLRLIAICFAIAAADGFDTQCISFVAPTLMNEWSLAHGSFGPLFSIGLLGAMVGAAVLGSVADRIGRRPVVLACVLLFSIMSLLSTTATSVEALGLYRFVGGIGLGGAMPNIIALTSEYAPQRHRSVMMVTMFCGFPLGAMAGGAVSHDIIDSHGWQGVFVLGGVVPLVLVVIAWITLPESARFLADRGRHPALERILAGLDISAPQIVGAAPEAVERRHSKLPASVLFEDGRAAWTLMLWALCFLGMLLTYFLVNWTPLLLVSVGFPQEKAIMGVVLLNAGGVVGGVALARLMDRINVFGILAAAFAIGAVCVFGLGATLETSLALTLAITCAVGLTVFGGQLNFPGLTANYYPVHMRSAGAGWAMAAGRVGSVVGPLIGGALLSAGFGTREVLYLAAVPAALAMIALLAMARMRRERTATEPQLIEGR